MSRLSIVCLLLLPLVSCRAPQETPRGPRTAAESSAGQRTSTTAEVDAFLQELATLRRSDRLRTFELGRTNEGRALRAVAVGSPPPEELTTEAAGDRLRVFVNGNIHGGEVEGKEASLQLLRAFADGRHADLLDRLVIVFLPVYNADGNDRIDRANRVTQNGPDGGVGERANAQRLDLNRDFVKVESPECAALMRVFRTFDPHVFMDLHTTNGTYHGYHLTYSPSLSTNVDTAIDAFARASWIHTIRAELEERHGFRAFDYGNASRGDEPVWATYDHRPRFGTNYYGLRNRFSLLSEAYSYLPFEQRIDVTRAFVLETLRATHAMADAIQRLCTQADERVLAGDVRFAWDTSLAPARDGEILMGAIDEVELEGLGTRRVARPEFRVVPMGIQDRFVSNASTPLPQAWVVRSAPAALVELLDHHGLAYERLEATRTVSAQRFTLTSVETASRPFQGHHNVRLTGGWAPAQEVDLPPGSLLVDGRQRLARVAAQLLEPLSEDSAFTWNLFDAALDAEGGQVFPVLRLSEAPARESR